MQDDSEKIAKTLRNDNTHLNKQLLSKNACSETKRKDAGVLGNLVHTNVKAPFVLRVIGARM